MNSMRFNVAPLSAELLQASRRRAVPGDLAAFAPPQPRPQRGANRLISLGIASAVQLAILAGLMFAGFKNTTPPPTTALIVDLLPQEKVAPPPARLQIKAILTAPAITTPALPTVQIYEPPPMAATTAPATIPTSAAPVRGTGNAAAVLDFQTKLLRHLSIHKRYPTAARAKRQQGVVYVRFSMDRRGNVLAAAVETASTFTALNAEGLALLTRAQPLPAPPVDVPGEPLELIVPVEFSLKN